MMQSPSINILIAEDNDVSRDLMASVLRMQGYTVYGAISGETAIKVVNDRSIDMALVDINMSPTGGFEFVKYLKTRGLDVPVVIITADESSDVLTAASSLGVMRVMQKPVEPQRLIQLVEQVLKRRGLGKPLAVEMYESEHAPEELMARAIELADKNAQAKKGGPFGAVVADCDGKILGEGVGGVISRIDPTAHAEVMAIRKAAEKLGQSDLSSCTLYCSSEPTMMGKALIASVGIETVYFGLSQRDMGEIYKHTVPVDPEYRQLRRDEALGMFTRWKS